MTEGGAYLSTPCARPPTSHAGGEAEQGVARGRSNAEVGDELGLSEATVRSHLTSILRKLGLRDRTQLVVMAYERRPVVPQG